MIEIFSDKTKLISFLYLGLSKIDRRRFEEMIKNMTDPKEIMFNHLSKYTKNPVVSKMIKYYLMKYWKDIEGVITDANKVYKILVERRPDIKDLLDTRQGRIYLNYFVKRMYQVLYEYTWL